MAKGRTEVNRRGHNAGDGKRAQAAARNRLPRLSSPEGNKERYDTRLLTAERLLKNGVPGEYTKPGSRNPKKVGRG